MYLGKNFEFIQAKYYYMLHNTQINFRFLVKIILHQLML